LALIRLLDRIDPAGVEAGQSNSDPGNDDAAIASSDQQLTGLESNASARSARQCLTNDSDY